MVFDTSHKVGGMVRGETVRNIAVADVIRSKRIRAGMSARHLSSLAGLSPSYVGKVESGDLEPSLKAFAHIAMVLELSMQEIVFVIGLASTDLLHGS